LNEQKFQQKIPGEWGAMTEEELEESEVERLPGT
jgi:hypothetical protein